MQKKKKTEQNYANKIKQKKNFQIASIANLKLCKSKVERMIISECVCNDKMFCLSLWISYSYGIEIFKYFNRFQKLKTC